jgi:hypothetical protein
MVARRSFINALLVLCLLWSQQAALAHAITHIPAPAGKPAHAAALAQSSQDTQDQVSDFCLDCLAFAQVTTATSGNAAVVGVALPAVILIEIARSGYHSTPLLPFHARGPPASL